MCKPFFLKNDYQTIDELKELPTLMKCIEILIKNECNLILSFNIDNNTILFSKEYSNWINKIDFSFKQFISRFNQIDTDSLIQEIYFCKIPEKYHSAFLFFLHLEYE